MRKAILWDNDGVLVDTEGIYFDACRVVLAEIGIDLTVELYMDISLRQGKSVFDLAAAPGMGAEEIERHRERRNDIYTGMLMRGVEPIPGVEAVLRALHGRARMAVVTGARRDHFETIHAQIGLMRYFEFALTSDDVARTKPYPEPYLAAVERLGLEKSECLVIEDSQRGLAAALAAGLDCIAVPTSLTRSHDFRGALRVLDSLGEALELIEAGL